MGRYDLLIDWQILTLSSFGCMILLPGSRAAAETPACGIAIVTLFIIRLNFLESAAISRTLIQLPSTVVLSYSIAIAFGRAVKLEKLLSSPSSLTMLH